MGDVVEVLDGIQDELVQIVSVQFPDWVIDQDEYVLYRPYSYVLPSEVVQIARDCAAGYASDYFLFQYDADEWVLVLTDALTVGESSFDCEGFSAYDIQYVDRSHIVTRDISGNLIGVEAGAAAEHFSGDYEVSEARPAFCRLFYETFEENELHVSTSEHAILYASVKGYASLYDSSSYYSFATVILLSGICMFYLINSIFKKVK